MQLRDLAAVADGHAVALEVADEVVGHRLTQLGAPVEQRDERPAPREPDGGLAGGVASADHGDPFGAAELCLGWAGGVESAHALVLRESLNRKAPVLRTGREQDCPRGDLAILLQSQEVASVSRLKGNRAIGRRQAGVEPRLSRERWR